MSERCIVCGKEGAKKIAIMDGYMDTGTFNVCATESCYRRIVSDGVFAWQKIKNESPK